MFKPVTKPAQRPLQSRHFRHAKTKPQDDRIYRKKREDLGNDKDYRRGQAGDRAVLNDKTTSLHLR